ncbi:MAG TPA: nucleotidyl transferase AbiEii/AbiGii toxin family protein [Bacillota bacterium]|nr:nucleotidyl transferase AbiEii/AbiGii toxin family protein [Bacillota bacterium]
MAEWNKLLLGKQAKELGFVRDTYEKVCRLTEILKFFENDDLLGRSLALKGGTAINLTIFNLPRLSVDIDLDFSENVPLDEMMALRSKISDQIEKYMIANDYSLSLKSKQYHALDSFVFEYSNAAGMNDNIKIEINYMLRCHILQIEQRRFKSAWESAGVSVLSVVPIEIFSSKIVALLNRTAPRDIYDIYNLVKFGLFDESEEILMRKCVVYYSAIASEHPPSEFKLSNIGQATQNQIKRDLYPVLRSKERFDLQAAQTQVKTWLEALLNLEDNEWEFLNAFRIKEYHPELLFESDEILERVKNHPMALWKCSQK